MRKTVEDYDRLVGMLYEVALEPARWDEPLHELLRLIDGTGFHLFGWNSRLNTSPFSAMSESWKDLLFQAYHTEYAKIDPHLSATAADPVGKWLVSHERFNDRFVSGNRFYQEFLIPAGVRHLMGTSLFRTPDLDVVAGVGRPMGSAPFAQDDIELVQRITPHFQRAVKLHMRTAELRAQSALGELGLSLMDVGVIALDAGRRLVFANRFAEKVLQAGTCLASAAGTLKAAIAKDDLALQAAMRRAMDAGSPQTVRLRNTRPHHDADSCCLTVMPVARGQGLGATLGAPALLILVDSPKHRRVPGARDFMERFGLTAAEASLAEALAAGCDLDQYATQIGVGKETVRSHLKAVFTKTGVRRQSQLVRMLAGVAMARGPQAGPPH